MSPSWRSDAERDAVLRELLDSGDQPAERITASSINRESLQSLRVQASAEAGSSWARFDAGGATRARVRLHGPAVVDNAAPVGLTARLLITFQNVVYAFAMSAGGKTAPWGAVPSEIRQAAQLRLFPQLLPGSLVLELAGPLGDMRFDGLSGGTNLADRSALALAAVIDAANERQAERSLENALLEAGPRVAGQLQRLAAFPLEDDLYLDLEWQAGNGDRIAAKIGPHVASVLRSAISASRATVTREYLEGRLVTVSAVESIGLELSDGKVLKLRRPDALDLRALAGLFQEHVVATVDAETVVTSSGRAHTSYRLIAVERA